MSVYSFSQIQLFRQCPLKYRFKYIDKIQLQDFEETADLLLGKAVHYALQRLYMDLGSFKKISLQELFQFYDYYWNKNFNENILIKGESSIQDYKNRGNNYLSLYYEKYFTQIPSNIIATESNIVFDLTENIKFRGVIDRIDNCDGEFVINDYKTNKTLPLESKQDYIEQLSLYSIGLKKNYGKFIKAIKARLYYLHYDLLDEWLVDDFFIANLVSKYKELIDSIEVKKFQYNMGDKDAFETNETTLCNYCEFHTICPLFSHLGFDDQKVGELSEKTIKNIIDEYVDITSKISELTAQKDNYKDLLVDYIQGKDFKVLYGNKNKISITKLVNYLIKDKDKLVDLVKRYGLENELYDIDRFKLAKLIKENKIEYTQLVDIIKKKESIVFRGK